MIAEARIGPVGVRSLNQLLLFGTTSAKLDIVLVHVAPPPRFSVREGLHDRVVTSMKVGGGVPHR